MRRIISLFALIFLLCGYCMAQTAPSRYVSLVENAQKCYKLGKWDEAIKILNVAKSVPGITAEHRDAADNLISKCNLAKKKAKAAAVAEEKRKSQFSITATTLSFEAAGGSEAIGVIAGSEWTVGECQDWFTATSTQNSLKVVASQNIETTSRKAVLELTMGNKTEYVTIEQAARAEVFKTVIIRTVPDMASISVDGGVARLKRDFSLKEGAHNIHIEKEGFMPKDTTLEIKYAQEDALEYVLSLENQFSSISVTVNPAPGYSFDENPTLEIGSRPVSLYPDFLYRFDQDAIQYYNLYEGNIIPLRYGGTYKIRVAAKGFYPQTREIELEHRGHADLDFTLVPICGWLTFIDEANADGAKLFLNGEPVCDLPASRIQVKSGKYMMKVLKPGYITDFTEREIEIPEEEEITIPLEMRAVGAYAISSNIPACKIWLDGKYVGTTPLNMEILTGEHKIRLDKNGYFPVEKTIFTAQSDSVRALDFILVESYPIEITSDKSDFKLIVSKGKSEGGEILSDNLSTPAKLELPLNKKPYRVRLVKDKKNYYRGRFRFDDPEKNHVKIWSWGSDISFFGGDWYLLPPPAMAGETINKDFERVADIDVVKIGYIRGLTTTVVKGALFWETNHTQRILYPANPSTGEKEINIDNPNYQDILLRRRN